MSEWLHQFISTVKKDKKRSLLIMVLAGVLILVIAWPVSEKNTSDADAGADGGYSAEASGGTAGDASGDDALKNEKSSDKTGAGPGALSDGQTLEAYVSDAQERLTKLLSSIEGGRADTGHDHGPCHPGTGRWKRCDKGCVNSAGE